MTTLASSDAGRAGSADALARGLGWFSVGLGLAELMAPRALTRMLGMEGHETLVRGYGAREVATGLAILSSRQPAPWVWGRVGGDVLDLATLSAALEDDNPKRGNVGLALAAVAGVTALDVLCATSLSRASNGHAPIPAPMHDYHGRSGFPRGAGAMRGAAQDFEAPNAFRIPVAMRPYTSGKYGASRGAGATPPDPGPGR